jgi:hypothetical protein
MIGQLLFRITTASLTVIFTAISIFDSLRIINIGSMYSALSLLMGCIFYCALMFFGFKSKRMV